MRPSKDPQTALGAALSELREEQGMTQHSIAKEAELPYAHYSDIESGKSKPLWGTMRRIAKAFDVTVAELAKREDAQSVD